jgi:hypothetical protein
MSTTPTTAPPSTPPTTTKVCADGQPPSIPVEDGSYVCPEFGAPPDQPTLPAPPTPPAAQVSIGRPYSGPLPATGAGQVVAIFVLGSLALVLGLALRTQRRRPVPPPSWPTADEVKHEAHPRYHSIRPSRPGKS